MKNKFFNSFLFLIWIIFSLSTSNANEAFTLNVTEIEILENGNKINGTNGGTAISDDGSTITGENFFYNKLKNILEITGNVKYVDNIKNVIIIADKIIYFKNDEKIFTIGNSKVVDENKDIKADNLEYDKSRNFFKAKQNAEINDYEKDTKIYAEEISYLVNVEKIFTKGKTKALIQKKYKFNSSDISYFRNNENIFSEKKTSIEDDNGNIYKLDKFSYDITKELLKAKEIEVLAKVEGSKIDKYFFSEGFFNFKNKSYIAKETKINIHKDVFGDQSNDPRIYGSTSSSDQNKTIVNNAIFTSCKLNDDCPPWSIKAEKITHDKIKKDMIYKNAVIKIYDTPILYFPKFFHPDSSVKRRSGFLQPRLNNSKTLGSSINIPYFKTLGPNKDLTFKPTLFEKFSKFEKEKYILQTEFRKKEKNSSLIADFAFLRDYKSSTNSKTKNINHLFLNYNSKLNIPNFIESRFEANIERVTNDTYLKVFENNLFDTPLLPESQTTLNSNVKLYLEKENQNL